MARALAVACVLALAATCAVAAAAIVSVRDRDDVSTLLDIARASGAHNRSADQLVHAVETHDEYQASDLANDDAPPSSICIEIWTRSEPGDSGPDYEACAVPDRRARALKGAISREREKGPDLRVGTVRLQRPTRTRLIFRIDPDHIKRPRSYEWRAETTTFGGGCRAASGCSDHAPDRPDVAETRIGRPKSG